MSDLTPVRDEDAFDIGKVHSWLEPYINQSHLPEVFQFRSGASNLTYLLKYPDRELVLLELGNGNLLVLKKKKNQ